MYAWLFMRFSGVALIVLVLGHLFIMLMLDGGVHRIELRLRRRPLVQPVLAGLGPDHAVAGPAAWRQRSAHGHRRLLPQGLHPLLAEHAPRYSR